MYNNKSAFEMIKGVNKKKREEDKNTILNNNLNILIYY